MSKELIQGEIVYWRKRLSQAIDTAIDYAQNSITEGARTYFEVALSYKIHLYELEEELRKIEKKEESEFKKKLKEELLNDL
jgi:hypothetical protein